MELITLLDLEVVALEPEARTHPHPILFVHGAWHAAWCWVDCFMPFFAAQGYACYAVSLRGHGGSGGQELLFRCGIPAYVEDVVQAASGLFAPPILVGHSMGGFTVQKYLEMHEAPAAVLLASCPPGGLAAVAMSVARRYPHAFLQPNLVMGWMPILGFPNVTCRIIFSALGQDKADEYFGKLQSESSWAFLDMMGLNLPRPARIHTPMLVLGGAEDMLIPPAEVQATAKAYRTQAEIFPGMGHDLMLDEGWLDVARRMQAWLAERNL